MALDTFLPIPKLFYCIIWFYSIYFFLLLLNVWYKFNKNSIINKIGLKFRLIFAIWQMAKCKFSPFLIADYNLANDTMKTSFSFVKFESARR
jgi:hypothetical protein